MIKRKTWTLSQRPGSYGKEQREQIHPPAKTWDEITGYNRALFLQAAALLKKRGFAGPFYAFGSRTKGTFVSGSDLDIGIVNIPATGVFIESLRLKEGKKVDIKPIAADPTLTYILIPEQDNEHK